MYTSYWFYTKYRSLATDLLLNAFSVAALLVSYTMLVIVYYFGFSVS